MYTQPASDFADPKRLPFGAIDLVSREQALMERPKSKEIRTNNDGDEDEDEDEDEEEKI